MATATFHYNREESIKKHKISGNKKDMSRTQNNTAQTLKLLALLYICYGHIFMSITKGQNPDFIMGKWWILGDIGLFYFAVSSAYFTAMHYASSHTMGQYWRKKLSRIGLQFLFINGILLLYFLIQGRKGVFTPLTLLNFFGLNGFLNWFHIPNTSPFGAGQWFITVLFLFYVFYPVMNRCFTTKRTVAVLLFVSAVTAGMGEHFFHYGHSLWSTSFGFVAGFYMCRNAPSLRKSLLFLCGLLFVLVVLKSCYRSSTFLTYATIAVMGYGLCLLTLQQNVPWLTCNFLRPLDTIFLPLFLMHGYFSKYSFIQQPHINALVILVCNVALAKIVALMYERLQKKILA